jgi:hypothetical protein
MRKILQIFTLILPYIAVNAAEIELIEKATGLVVGKIDSATDSEVTINGKIYIARIKTSETNPLSPPPMMLSTTSRQKQIPSSKNVSRS